jgi:hypothetical protein
MQRVQRLRRSEQQLSRNYGETLSYSFCSFLQVVVEIIDRIERYGLRIMGVIVELVVHLLDGYVIGYEQSTGNLRRVLFKLHQPA